MRTLHLISHTHWDREWYLTFQQFRLKLVHLVDNLLDILERDPNYRHYMLDGQTIVLEDYLQIRPERAADLRRYIQEGRILIGPWYILPDEFLVSPEATVRNLLEGDRTARDFGPKMMVGYIPDPFGHIGQMPQILQGFEIGSAAVMRGLADEPCEFWWQSPDGSRVVMAYLRESYGNAAGILNAGLAEFPATAQRLGDVLAAHAAAEDLLLMHGVDHMEPHPDTSAAVALAAEYLPDARVVHSTLPDYFQAVETALAEKDLPVITGELRSSKRHPLLPAVLSTRMWIKQRNHACETLLEKWAEPFSAWAACFPAQRLPEGALRDTHPVLRQAWRLLIQCHPHDSICGCSIDAVHDEMRARFDQVEQMAEAITVQSLETLANAISTSAPDGKEAASALVVFNPAFGPRTDLVSAELETQAESGAFELVDEHGSTVPFHALGLGSRDLITMTLPRADFRSAFLMTAGGDIMGLKLMELDSRVEGSKVFIEIVLSEKGEPEMDVLAASRDKIAAYLEDHHLTEYQIHARSVAAARVQFAAPQIPGQGYRTFCVRPKAAPPQPQVQISPLARALMPLAARLAASPAAQRILARVVPDPAKKRPHRIENQFFAVEVEPGGTLSVLDKRSGVTYRGQNRFVDGGDRGDEYNFSPPAEDRLIAAQLKEVRVERGEVIQSLDIHLEMQIPAVLDPGRKARGQQMVSLPIHSRVTLVAGVPRVDIHTKVDNHARDHRLRVHFPMPFAADSADYDGHFAVVRRPLALPESDSTWVEQPRPETHMRAFTALRGEQAAALLAARGLPEVEVLRSDGGGEIALTLLRSVGWLSRDDFPERSGHAGPFLETPGAQVLGPAAFDYALVPFAPADFLAAYQQAYAFQTPLRAVNTTLHAGIMPAHGAFIACDTPAFALSTVKPAEDGRGWIARGYNLTGEEIRVSLRALLPLQAAYQTSMAEVDLTPLEVEDGQQVRITAGPFAVVSLRFV